MYLLVTATRDLNKLYLPDLEDNDEDDDSDHGDSEDDDSDNEEINVPYDEILDSQKEMELLASNRYEHKEAMAGLTVTRIPCCAHKVSFHPLLVNCLLAYFLLGASHGNSLCNA